MSQVNHPALRKQHESPRPMWRLRKLVLATALAIGAGTSYAQAAAPAAQVAAEFDLPAQRLDTALHQVAEQQQLQILFAPRDVEGITAPSLRGNYTAQQAIDRLTSGTGLTYTYDGHNTFVIKAAAARSGTLNENPNALASAPAAAGVSETVGKGLEEVIVTAQKNEQSLQDTPLAISAFDEKAIERQGITNVVDVGRFTPNVQIVETPSSATGATIAMRGSVTVNPNINWEPTVGLYLDGVFIGKNIGGVFDIAELERVEVLRGPQGTLYGKNTIGGAVNLITRKPSGEFSGKVQAGVGNKNLRSVYARFDAPRLELGLGSVDAGMSVMKKKRDGLYDNVPDRHGNPLAGAPSSRDFKNIDAEGARAELLWQVAPEWTIDYTFDYHHQDQLPPAAQLTAVTPSSRLYPGPIGLESYLVPKDDPAASISNDRSFFERSKSLGHALVVDYDAGELGVFGDVRFKSTTAYRTLEWSDSLDLDGSPIYLYHSERHIDYDQRSQEFQVTGETERTNYVLGLYYFAERGEVYSPLSFFGAFGSPTAHNSYGLDNEALAAYGQIDWRPEAALFDDRLTLTLGTRWTRERKDQSIFHPDASIVIPYTEADDSWSNFSPAFTVAWALDYDINVYARVANGWKSGGFNSQAQTLESFLASYNPEKVRSYEVGIKSQWLDNRLRVNAAAFHNKEDDLQLSVFLSGNSFASVVRNAGKATIEGFELEVAAQLTDTVQLSASYGYLDADYDEFIERGIDVKDDRLFPYAPTHTASLAADWTLLVSRYGKLDLHVDWSFTDDYVVGVMPDATSNIGAYRIVNARLTLADMPVGDSQSLKVSLWGKNLTDETYRVNTINFDGWTISYFGDPRTYGADITYEF